jgi:CRISPR/Cas system Type II protein with McrA/HNH and RuvC-like nuclease domain
LSLGTVVCSIRDLAKKGHIEIQEIHHKGKIYMVKLPSEIKESLRFKQEKNKILIDELPEDYYKNPINRKNIFERDDYKCYYCGEKVTQNNATLDHKTPISKGGDNSKENLVTCCFECNSIKSGKTLEEVAPKLLERVKNRTSKQK